MKSYLSLITYLTSDLVFTKNVCTFAQKLAMMNEQEIWMPVLGYEYEMSDHGRVRNSRRGWKWMFFMPPAIIYDLNSFNNLTCIV